MRLVFSKEEIWHSDGIFEIAALFAMPHALRAGRKTLNDRLKDAHRRHERAAHRIGKPPSLCRPTDNGTSPLSRR
jgi:hypothetical protein